MRTAATTPVATTAATTIETPSGTRATRALRTHPARAIARPRATRTTRRLRPTQPTRPRPVRRRPRTTRQPTTRTTSSVSTGTTTATRHPDPIRQRIRRRRPRRRPQIRGTATTITRTSPCTTPIEATRRRSCRAANVDLQNLTRRYRDAALHATTATAVQDPRCTAPRTDRIDLQRGNATRDSEGLRRIRAGIGDGLRPARCHRDLGAERLTRGADSDDLVVVRRADRQAAVLPHRRRGATQRDRIRQARAAREPPVDLPAGNRRGIGRRRPREHVVALEARCADTLGRVLQVLDRRGLGVVRSQPRPDHAVTVCD